MSSWSTTLFDGRTVIIGVDEGTDEVYLVTDVGTFRCSPLDMGLVCLGLQEAAARAGQRKAGRRKP